MFLPVGLPKVDTCFVPQEVTTASRVTESRDHAYLSPAPCSASLRRVTGPAHTHTAGISLGGGSLGPPD